MSEPTRAHEHGHHHHHGHGHHHDHDHGAAEDTYFIDQLCMVGLSGGFGVICLCLYFWKQQMLTLLLGPQFHLYVLGSGGTLLLLALLRGALLWQQAGKAQGQPHHHHHHDHEHEHAAAHSHQHNHGECCGSTNGAHEHHHHSHGEHHHHHHDHSHADHDHGWAPWRYVLLLVPVILFMLGLPNKGPEAKTVDVKVDYTEEATGYARLVGLGSWPLPAASLAAALNREASQGEAQAIDFKALEGAASNPDSRSYWKDKVVEVRGQYSPDPRNDRVFGLVRFRISCCAADAIQLNVPILSKEPIRGIKRNDWVKVSGKVNFVERDGAYSTVVLVPSRSRVEACSPDLNPWVQ